MANEQSDKSRPLNENFFRLPPGNFRDRMTRKELQAAILAGPHLVPGRLCDPVGKHVGAGIYEVEMKERA
jgi:hypothetical protein